MLTFFIVLGVLLLINTFLFLFSRNKEDEQAPVAPKNTDVAKNHVFKKAS